MTDDEIQSIYDATVIPPYEHAQWLAFAHAIAAAEREECAQVCEEFDACDPKHIAAAIRARARNERHAEDGCATSIQNGSRVV